MLSGEFTGMLVTHFSCDHISPMLVSSAIWNVCLYTCSWGLTKQTRTPPADSQTAQHSPPSVKLFITRVDLQFIINTPDKVCGQQRITRTFVSIQQSPEKHAFRIYCFKCTPKSGLSDFRLCDVPSNSTLTHRHCAVFFFVVKGHAADPTDAPQS